MALEWEQVNVDSSDHERLGQWWADLLGWVIVNDRMPGLLFVAVPEGNEFCILGASH